jgi:hypothetical protein
MNRDVKVWQIDQVRRDTLGNIFRRMNIRDEDAMKFLMLGIDARAINNPADSNHTLEIKTNLNGRLLQVAVSGS